MQTICRSGALAATNQCQWSAPSALGRARESARCSVKVIATVFRYR